MWCLSVARNQDRLDSGSRPSLSTVGKRLLFWLAAMAVVGAGVLIRSGSAPKRTDPTIDKPKAILFVVQGTASDPQGPGIAAFVAVIRPAKRYVGVVPVHGSLSTPDGTLADIAGVASAPTIAQDVATGLRIRLGGYIVIDVNTVYGILTTAAQAPGWPIDIGPDQALADLGWPGGTPSNKASISMIQDLIKYLPQLPGTSQTLLVTDALRGTSTNLSPYELFVLVTYINDERITPLTLHSLPASLRQKQVKH
jgi:hypothetical protein